MEKTEKTKSKGNMYIKYGEAEVTSKPSDGYYPSLTLTDKAVPELMDKKVGDECSMMVKGKIKSVNAREGGDTTIELEVHDAKYGKEGAKHEAMEYDKAKVGKAAGMMKKIKSMRKA